MNKIFYAPADIVSDYCADLHAPSQDFMKTDEVLSWIAYRKSYVVAEWQKKLFRFSRDWKFADIFGGRRSFDDHELRSLDPDGEMYFWVNGSAILQKVLQSMEQSGKYVAEDHEMFKHYPSEQYLTEYLNKITTGKWAVSFGELHKELSEDMYKQKYGFHYLRQAGGDLRRRLYNGELNAWGRTPREDELKTDRFMVEKDTWTPGVIIDHNGTVGYEGQSGFFICDLIFDSSEVLKIWTEPYSDNQSNTSKTYVDSANISVIRSGGRPEHPAKLSFVHELLRLANTPDGLPDSKDLQKIMEEWAVRWEVDNTSASAPSRATIQNWLNEYDYRRQKPKSQLPKT